MEWHELYMIGVVTILCGRHHDLVDRYGISVSQMTTDRFHLSSALSESFFHSWLITGFVTRLTRWVPMVEQELSPFWSTWVHPSPRFFVGVCINWSLVLFVYFEDCCLSFYPFSVGHCVVCPSSIYGFWLPLSHRQTFLIFTRSFKDIQYCSHSHQINLVDV